MTDDPLVPQGPRGIAYEGPTLIKAADAPRFLWGDGRAGYVSDWIYGSSPRVHMMSFEMPVGTRFGNSPDFKTFYNCAETYHCLKGEFTFHCPETGEVHVLRRGDTLWFPPDTWHWGYNFGAESCWILECLTPRTEEAVEAYAARQPWLETILTDRRAAAAPFVPGAAQGPARARVARHDRPDDLLWEVVGEERLMRVGLACHTEMLTVGFVDLHRGQEGPFVSHGGDKVIYALEGRSNLYLPDHAPNWWEMVPGDAGFVPGGVRHAFFNTSDAPARLIFGVAPDY